MSIRSTAAPAIRAAFLASSVEVVEAFTIAFAVASVIPMAPDIDRCLAPERLAGKCASAPPSSSLPAP